jgi:K+-transporting ATPase ATPase B chain
LQVSRRRTESQAKLLAGSGRDYRLAPGTSLKVGDVVPVEARDNIPSDGEVIEGVASVNEAAITRVCVANTIAEIDDHVLAA